LNETLTPEDLADHGQRAFQEGRHQEAAQMFLAAAEGYQLAGERPLAAEMQNNRSVALLQADEPQAALEAVLGTPQIFADAGDPRRQAMALGNQAAAHQALSQFDEAVSAYQQSADLLAELGEDELRATVMRSLSEVQLRSGRHLEAVASMQSGLGGLKKPNVRQRVVKKLLEMPFKFMNR
jgi:tetratricopeptide (TPR) repeat protein